eukprot:COSAG01_NODE_129_length_24935_cov_39.324368_27_plen_112_part_00
MVCTYEYRNATCRPPTPTGDQPQPRSRKERSAHAGGPILLLPAKQQHIDSSSKIRYCVGYCVGYVYSRQYCTTCYSTVELAATVWSMNAVSTVLFMVLQTRCRCTAILRAS